jgi:hypothetical protein
LNTQRNVSRKLSKVWILVMAVALLAPSAAADSDGCAGPSPSGGLEQEAGDSPDSAALLEARLQPGALPRLVAACAGSLGPVHYDRLDWYWTPALAPLGPTRVDVEVCPTFVGGSPLEDPIVELYYQADPGSPLVLRARSDQPPFECEQVDTLVQPTESGGRLYLVVAGVSSGPPLQPEEYHVTLQVGGA